MDDLKAIDPEIPTLEYELYADDLEGTHDRVPDTDEVTPEEGDIYIGAEVKLSFGGMMLTGTVKWRKRNASGNVISMRNENPMLDT